MALRFLCYIPILRTEADLLAHQRVFYFSVLDLLGTKASIRGPGDSQMAVTCSNSHLLLMVKDLYLDEQTHSAWLFSLVL